MQEAANLGFGRVVNELANGIVGQENILTVSTAPCRSLLPRYSQHAKAGAMLHKTGACYRSDQERIQGEPPDAR